MPEIHESVYVAETAFVFGSVTVGEDSSLWPGASLRGDMGSIEVGRGSSIQDSCSLHVQPGGKVVVGDLTTVGHGAVIHGATIGNLCVVGMNATVLDGAVIGDKSIVAAGAVVKGGTQVPPGSLVVGNPAVVKEGRTPDMTMHWYGALLYIAMAHFYRDGRTEFSVDDILKAGEKLKEKHPMP